MNERIRELALQAGFRNGTFDGFWIDNDGVNRFTELIVQECTELMKKESEEYSNIGSDYCDHKAEAFDEAVDLVKKHFGVK
jgi:hypothetical protein